MMAITASQRRSDRAGRSFLLVGALFALLLGGLIAAFQDIPAHASDICPPGALLCGGHGNSGLGEDGRAIHDAPPRHPPPPVYIPRGRVHIDYRHNSPPSEATCPIDARGESATGYTTKTAIDAGARTPITAPIPSNARLENMIAHIQWRAGVPRGQWASIGHGFTYSYTNADGIEEQASIVLRGFWDYDCHYPATFTTEAVFCMEQGTVQLTRTVPAPALIATTSRVMPFADNPTLQNCEGSLSLAVADNPDRFGRYLFSGQITGRWCEIRNYADGAPRRLGDCSDLVNSTAPERHWQLTCAGFTEGWHGNPSWTLNDCGGGLEENAPECSVPGNNSFDGVSIAPGDYATSPRDGDLRTVNFGLSELQGPGLTITGGRQTLVTREGTPWNPSRPVGDNEFQLTRGNQNYLRSAEDTDWRDGTLPDNWGAAGQWASDPGDMTILQASYLYEVDVRRTFSIPVSYELVAVIREGRGNIETVPTMGNRTFTISTEGTCHSEPLNINYVRSTSDR